MNIKVQQAADLLSTLQPTEIIKAVRYKDMKVIKALVIDGIKNRRCWSVEEVVELTGVPMRTVYSWMESK